jgi:uncharacterized protein YceK
MLRIVLLTTLVIILNGCGASVSTEDAENVKAAVTKGLAAWQAKKQANTLPDDWKFLDEDWKAGNALSEYTITNVTMDKDKLHRCWVTLKVVKQGKIISKEICYIVDLSRKLINRDPYA